MVDSKDVISKYEQHMNECSFHLAIAQVFKLVSKVNAFFHEQEPWKQAKTDIKSFEETIYTSCCCLKMISILLWPVMPENMEKILDSLGVVFDVEKLDKKPIETFTSNNLFNLKKIDLLFIKYQ